MVALLAEGDDLAFQVPGGESLVHVLGERPAIAAHAVDGHGSAVATVRCGREEVKLSAPLLPQFDDLRKTIGRGVMGFIDEQGFAVSSVGSLSGFKWFNAA